MIASSTKYAFTHGIPESFEELCRVFLPRPIHDSVGHDNTLEIIHALAGLNLNSDQEDYLETLGTLVNEYETKHMTALPSASPVEVLRFLTEEHRISTRELSRILGKDESLGSKILSGERAITVEHAVKLSKRFGVRAELFLKLD